jgi:hypothetical protein
VLFAALNPGGRLLVPNFTPGIKDVGYMEAFMDWFLICRTEIQVRDLTSGIPESEISDIRSWADEEHNVVYVLAQKRRMYRPAERITRHGGAMSFLRDLIRGLRNLPDDGVSQKVYAERVRITNSLSPVAAGGSIAAAMVTIYALGGTVERTAWMIWTALIILCIVLLITLAVG